MSLAIHMLGRPHLERDGEPVARPRGHKGWGLLAYLSLSRVRNPSREHLAELLFTGADDPLGSLRWNLAELRRALGPATLPHGSTELALPPGTFMDIDALIRGTPQEAVAIPGLGSELLEGMSSAARPPSRPGSSVSAAACLAPPRRPSTKPRSTVWRQARRPQPSDLRRGSWS